MDELIERLEEKGFEKEKAEQSTKIIMQWVSENYPIAAAGLKAWFREDDN